MTGPIRGKLASVALVAVVSLTAGCGKSSNPSQPSSTSGTYDGSWNGTLGANTTSLGTISFKVANSSVTGVTFFGLGTCFLDFTVTPTTTIRITNNAFTFDTGSTSNPDVAMMFSGQFSSGTAGSGTLNVTFKRVCSGTYAVVWSASKS